MQSERGMQDVSKSLSPRVVCIIGAGETGDSAVPTGVGWEVLCEACGTHA